MSVSAGPYEGLREDGPAGIREVRAHPDRRTLTVTFFGVLPPDVDRTRFVVEGGRRIVGIRVLRVHPGPGQEAGDGAANRLRLTLDRPGDDSTYRLRALGRGFHGGHDHADFTFHPTLRHPPRPAPKAPHPVAPPAGPAPAIDYLAKDYASFRRLLLERLSLTLPRWTERHAPDLWVTLVELLAHVGDRLSYQQDAVATEAYLDTARLRTSVRRHARLVGYPMHDGCAARTVVCVETATELTLDTGDLAFTALPEDDLAQPSDRPDGPVISPEALVSAPHPAYQPLERRRMRLLPAHNGVPLWAWGQDGFALPAGATRAALLDDDGNGNGGGNGSGGGRRVLDLKIGDLLVLEETHSPGGGPPDPGHRQAVRLTRATRDVDANTGTAVVKIAWADEDALAFPLCVRNPRGPDGRPGATVVARGNALLVQHGLDIIWFPGGESGELVQVPGRATDGTVDASPARPRPVTLRGGPVTWSPPYPRPADLAAAQGRRLLGLAARARDGLRDLHHGVAELQPESRELLTALFGASFLDDFAGLADDAERRGRAARFLSVFEDFFEPRLRRLETLALRARAGYVLDHTDAGWELAQTWGEGAAAGLDPADPALHGPASSALRPDPREALPALYLTEDPKTGPDWAPRRDLLASGPRDRHLVAETDDEGVLALRFGDDRCGRAPRPGAWMQAYYRVGNGRSGNAGGEAVNRIAHRTVQRLEGITRVRNPVPVSGGTDPEPLAQVRLAAPRAPFRTLLRAVTAEDYATLAMGRPDVQRAAASLRWTGSWYEADVALDPAGAAVPSPALLAEVRAALHRYRRIGHDVVTRPALLVPLAVALNVLVDPHYVTADVREALMRRLLPGRRTDGEPGFFDPAALTFGTPVRSSALVALCMGVPGVRHAEVTVLRRIHGPGPEREGPDVPPSGELRLRPLEVPRLDGDVTRQENGWLTLRLRGGR
ncbi:putative baseplate assembly protein [Streptomyces sp. NBC_01485]|uniref:putative baseplate assembly protein n=1 Tax=Streptomyces sp. NBC_01485 TaxID=2903884 RepID=UPI002E2FC39A|nr:putative baseplate assembly protein [Streptomyces sp. NBC_01485]